MEKSLNADMGEKIRAERKKLGLTREQLAEKLNLSYSFLSDLERGKCGPGLDNLIALADCFGVSADYILGHEVSGDYTFITRHFDGLTLRELRSLEQVVCAAVDMLSELKSKEE